MRLATVLLLEDIRAAGTPEGAKKGWDTRGRGRHPAHAEMQKAVKGMNKRGWLAHPTRLGFQFHHPAHPDRLVYIHRKPDGTVKWDHWTHRDHYAQGHSAHSLLRNVDKWSGVRQRVAQQGALGRIANHLKKVATNETLRKVLNPEPTDQHGGLYDEVMNALDKLLDKKHEDHELGHLPYGLGKLGIAIGGSNDGPRSRDAR